MTDADRRDSSWLAYGAALWSLTFACLHIVWAAGSFIGLEAEFARKAFAQHWFLAYDLAVAGTCLFGVAIALALVRPWGRRLPRWAVGGLAWAGTGLLTLRAASSLAQVLYLVVQGSFVVRPMHFWEIWFYVGAILFGSSTWRFWTARSKSSSPPNTRLHPTAAGPDAARPRVNRRS